MPQLTGDLDQMRLLLTLLLARVGGSVTFNAGDFDRAAVKFRTDPAVIEVWRDDAYRCITITTDQTRTRP